MKKVRFVWVLVIILLFAKPVKVQAQDEQIYFATPYSSEICEGFLEYYIDDIASIIAGEYLGDITSIMYGNPIGVYNLQNYFYVPLYINDEIVYVINVVFDDSGEGYISFGDRIANILCELTTGVFCFWSENDSVYLVGDNEIILIETANELSNEENELNIDNGIMTVYSYEVLYSDLHLCGLGLISGRAVLSGELEIPYISNHGTNGYCWLCAANGICAYYGYPIEMANAHVYVHGTYHSLYDCTGGTRNDALTMMRYFAHVDGANIGRRLTFGEVMVEIQNGRPVYSSWGHSINQGDQSVRVSGHAMVVCGFTYNPQYSTFTYKLRDSNNSAYQYVYTYTYDSSVVYYIGGLDYVWDGSIYNIQ